MKGFPRFIWVLLGLLAIGAGVLSLGKRDVKAEPSAFSLGPSGVSAFVDLLRKAGYEVRIDKRSHPVFDEREVGIAFRTLTPATDLHSTSQLANFKQLEKEQRFQRDLLTEVGKGARAFLFMVPNDFLDHSRDLLGAKPVSVDTSFVEHRTLQLRSLTQDSWMPPGTVEDVFSSESDEAPIADEATVRLWWTSKNIVAHAHRIGKGSLVTAEASFLTNRFIDQAEDADGALRLVRILAHPGDRIVIAEAGVGDPDDPGLIEAIGAWALGAWRQLIVLGVVVIYTLGKRFGIPDESRAPQRGSRDLVDGLTFTFQRGRQTRAAIATAKTRIDSDLRNALRLPRDASEEDLRSLLNPTLVDLRYRLDEAASSPSAPSHDAALDLISRARRETEAFLRERRYVIR